MSASNSDSKCPTSHDLVTSKIELVFCREERIALFLLQMASSEIESAVSEISVPSGQMDLFFLGLDLD